MSLQGDGDESGSSRCGKSANAAAPGPTAYPPQWRCCWSSRSLWCRHWPAHSSTYHVGFTGAVPEGTETALAVQAKAVDHKLETTRYATLADGERAVRDKKVDVLLVDGTRLEWRSTSDSTLSAAIANAVQAVHIRQQADQLGISADQLGQLLVPVTLTSRTIGAAHTSDKDANTVGFIAVGALFLAISFYAGFVLTGVVQEKSNRVSEVLLARMPAREVLAGKVLGIGAVGLANSR